MADTYVCSGAMMRCTFGTSTARLRVLPDRTVWLAGQRMANIMDHKSLANIPGFGRCRTVTYPATGAATAAAHGKLTPMPCIPGTLTPWMPGKNDYLIQGLPALLKSCKCMCQWGGVITITDDGQHGEGNSYVNRAAEQTFEDWDESIEGLDMPDQDSILDGIQLGLSVAGLVPAFGAVPDLLNAAISAARGNWSDAGLSVFAAVPLIGDVAAGIKLTKIGVNAAKTAKITKAVRAGEKVRGEIPPIVVNKVWKKLRNYDKPPYKLGGKVQSIELTENTTFVRVYGDPSRMKSQWVMRKEEIKGLTPKQIKDKFALPDEPSFMCEIELPKGTRMHKGIANGVDGWGRGGGTQYDLRLKNIDGFKNESVINGVVR